MQLSLASLVTSQLGLSDRFTDDRYRLRIQLVESLLSGRSIPMFQISRRDGSRLEV
jgi:hypothetical protein